MHRKLNKKYSPKGKFKKLSEHDRGIVFFRTKPDSYIEDQVNMLSSYLQNFGIVSSREVIMMLALWMCDPKNKEESQEYWRRLDEKNIHFD